MENKKMELTAQNVDKLIKKCLYREDEFVYGNIPDDHIRAEGIMKTFLFHPGRIKENEAHIIEMLLQLPEDIKEGCSFLNLCTRKDNFLWGEHADIEALIALGIAIDKTGYMFPRKFWDCLPGKVPYIIIK